jgi:hypothetical protein
MYLQGSVENHWSVAQMRNQRWEAMGGHPEQKPRETDIVAAELDEDAPHRDDSQPTMAISETFGEVHDAESQYDDEPRAEFDSHSDESDAPSPTMDAPAAPLLRPFEALPPLPPDLNEGFELMKLAILNHKVSGWREIDRDDVLSVLESLRQLVLAPAE